MGEYLLLAVFVTVLSVATVWIVRTIGMVGKACYRAFLPSSRENIKQQLEKIRSEKDLPHLSDQLPSVQIPWGWKNLTPRIAPRDRQPAPPMAQTLDVAIPWGWPGNTMSGKSGAHDLLENLHEKFDKPLLDALYLPVVERHPEGMIGIGTIDIESHRGSGFYLVPKDKVPLKEARAPWGW